MRAGEKRSEVMISTMFTATAATTLQDLIDERSARDVVDLAAHRRQRSERNQSRAAVSNDGAAVEGR
jgi:hypothetical protein